MPENKIFDLFDISDIPGDLKKDLIRISRSETEERIIELLTLAGGELSLNQLQVGYYRKYGEIKERRKLTAKLYMMCRSENAAVTGVKGKKGKYRLIHKQSATEKQDENVIKDQTEDQSGL